MRSLAFSLLFLMAALAANARVPLRGLEHIVVSGSDYIRVEDWAENAGFGVRWAKTEGTVTLTSPAGRVELTINSRRAEIGGVTVWLSLPVVNRSGTVLLSLVDASATLGPILFPRKIESRLTTICLDPGHGGKDTGTADGHNYEKKYTLLLAQEVAGALQKAGLKVLLTRDTDSFVDLSARPLLAKRRGADLFVSLHYNSAERYVHGLEIYCLPPPGVNSSDQGGGKSPHLPEAGNAHDEQNALLAYDMQKSLLSGVAFDDLGVKRSRFEVLREATMPAILIEGGFMSNASDARKIYDAAFRKKMARAIVDGILAYKKSVEREFTAR